MKRKILISEHELIGLIKNIFESEDTISDYDEIDLKDIFITIFRTWLKNKFPNQYENYPLSFLIKKYAENFLKDIELDPTEFKSYDGEFDFTHYRLRTLISKLFEKGKITLPKVPSQSKITERYKKAIDFFVQQLELPSYAKLTMSEPSINKIDIGLEFDFLDYLQSNEKVPYPSEIERKFSDFLESYLGLQIGQPIHGEVSLKVNKPVYYGQDAWVKHVLNKDLKKKIRELPFGNKLHSIKYLIEYKKPKLKFTFKDGAGYQGRRDFKTKVDELLKSMGYHNFELEI